MVKLFFIHARQVKEITIEKVEFHWFFILNVISIDVHFLFFKTYHTKGMPNEATNTD